MKTSEMIIEIRKHGLSDCEIARQTKMHQPTVTRIKNGKSSGTGKSADKIEVLYKKICKHEESKG